MLAEQNIDIIEGLETLRADTKNSSVEFAAIMESCFLAVSDDIKYALKANQEVIADLSVKLDIKFKEIDDKFKDDTESNGEQGNLKKTLKESKAKPNKGKIVEKDVPRSSEKPCKEKSLKDKHKVTWVGTSISKVLDKKKFEQDIDVKLTAVKAYCVKE